MRYDTRVRFYLSQKDYDPYTSRHTTRVIQKWDEMANVTSPSAERQVKLMGKIDDTTRIIRLPFNAQLKWSYCTIGESQKHYKKQATLQTLKGVAFLVGENHVND